MAFRDGDSFWRRAATNGVQPCPEFGRFWDDGSLLPQTRQTDIPRLASWLPGYALRGGTCVWILRDALRLLPQRWPIIFVATACGHAWPQAVALTGLVTALAEVLFAIVTVRLLDRRFYELDAAIAIAMTLRR